SHGVMIGARPAAAATPASSASSVALSALEGAPVVITGSQVPDWSAGPELTARAPQAPTNYGTADSQRDTPARLRSDCYQANPAPDVNGWTDPNHGDHNCFQSSQLPVRTLP